MATFANKSAAPLLAALVLGFGASAFIAAPAVKAMANTGTVSGTVDNADGKPVAHAKVRLLTKADADERREKHDKAGQTAASPLAEKDKGDRHEKVKPVATGETDEQGKFTLANVTPGEYVVVANLKGQGVGHQAVTVTAGQEVTVTLTLKAGKDKKHT